MKRFIRVSSLRRRKCDKVINGRGVRYSFVVVSDCTEPLFVYNFLFDYDYYGLTGKGSEIWIGGNNIELNGERWKKKEISFFKNEYFSGKYGSVLIDTYAFKVSVSKNVVATLKYDFGIKRMIGSFKNGNGFGEGIGYFCTVFYDEELVDAGFALAIAIQAGLSSGGD